MHIGVVTAALLGLFYWAAQISAGYGLWIGTPLMTGAVAGLILGDVATGCKIGAVIQPMFLAFTGGGGTVVWDQTAGTIGGCAQSRWSGGLPICSRP